jgi:hypothetical protein
MFYLAEDERKIKFEEVFLPEDYRPQDQELWDDLRASLLPNIGVMAHISSGNNDDPLLIGHFEETLVDLNSRPQSEQIERLQRLGVTVLLSPQSWSQLEKFGQVGLVHLYQIPASWPRASVAACEIGEDGLHCVPRDVIGVEIVEDTGNHLKVTVNSDEAGYLLLLDTDYTGWQAKVNGESVPIHRANGMFRAVAIPDKVNLIEFDYYPRSVQMGLLVTVSGIVGLGCLVKLAQAASSQAESSP